MKVVGAGQRDGETCGSALKGAANGGTLVSLELFLGGEL